MRRGVRVDGEVLDSVVYGFCWLSDHHCVFLLDGHVVNDVLDLVVVGTGPGDWHPDAFLHVVCVLFLVGDVLYSALGRRGVRVFAVVLDLSGGRGTREPWTRLVRVTWLVFTCWGWFIGLGFRTWCYTLRLESRCIGLALRC